MEQHRIDDDQGRDLLRVKILFQQLLNHRSFVLQIQALEMSCNQQVQLVMASPVVRLTFRQQQFLHFVLLQVK